MSGFFWSVFIYCVLGFFLISLIYRIIAIYRLPVHLRWELAPIPHEKDKNRYGGSYLEDFEWWKKTQRRSRLAPLVYIAREIIFLISVLKNNRNIWPFSLSMHQGIYFVTAALIFHIIIE